MINPGLQRYEVVLDDRHFLRELTEGITLEDTLEEVAYRANISLVVTPDLQKIGFTPGQAMRVSGVPFGGSTMTYLLHPGVLWECDTRSKGQKHLAATVYDLTIYLSKSDDEYLFPAGQTATQRLKQYAKDWGIPTALLPETSIPLAKAVYRSQSIWSMIQSDLKETVKKGGAMYSLRMTPGGLDLFKIGSNATVWVLEEEQNIEETGQKRTLEGAITKVKVLGNAAEDQRSPVLAVVSKDTDKYGTLQKTLSDSKLNDTGSATSAGTEMLTGLQETITLQGVDVNTIRAGDKVIYNNMERIVASIHHELGSPGHMSLEIGDEAYIRRRYFGSI